VAEKGGVPDRKLLNDWWVGRSIPASRQGIREALEVLDIRSTQLLIDKCMGLSLSDQYWVRPMQAAVAWSDVNFFQNAFSADVGNILFGGAADGESMNLMSPDNTSDGWLRKRWMIADSKRYLVKGGSNPFRQEPVNEALATEIARRLGIRHVPYTLMFEGGNVYSVCENFITPQTELISARYIMQTRKQPNHVSNHQHFLACCDELGIPGAVGAIDQMLALDFLIVNEDRHFHNFGAIRDAETLAWIGLAPIFDSGTSMWHDLPTHEIGEAWTDKSKPFRATHARQVKLVTSLDFVDFAKLVDLADAAQGIYKRSPFIDEYRRDRLCRALAERVRMLVSILPI
jgi:hypothetical protein